VAPDAQQSSGWQRVTREGAQVDRAALVQNANLGLLRTAELDPGLRAAVVELFRLGRYGDAVMVAFREVEIRVRAAAGLAADDVGKDLMRKAFGAGCPLRDPDVPAAEQEGVMQLLMGAIAVLKNPHSHRLVNIEDPQEAAESVLFANSLLRLVGRAVEAAQAGDASDSPH
jgi:uncharacterized protein (TIGR02391 family)